MSKGLVEGMAGCLLPREDPRGVWREVEMAVADAKT
jgi:hypothetical protein